MVSNNELDAIDLKIIELLMENGRKSFRKIADIIGKSEATVRRRVKRMIDEKYIKKFTLILEDKGNLAFKERLSK